MNVSDKISPSTEKPVMGAAASGGAGSGILLENAGPTQTWQAGTLRYTRVGLWLLFSWLLWGHFIYVIMEAVIPSVLPLLLKQHRANAYEISFISTSLNLIGNMIFNPIVSFWSDRYRGRGGRRRPFILYTTPLVVVFLILVPFGPGIADSLASIPSIGRVLALSPVVPAVLLIAVFVMGFQIFDVFVGSIYYYLVRDTVPDEFLGRFNGLFRVVGGLAPMTFNWFVLEHAEAHMKAVFIGVAVFYGVGMCLMCWGVREGEFPPPEPLPAGRGRWYSRLWASVVVYCRDCLRDRIYGLTFLAVGCAAWSHLASSSFAILFYREELNISLKSLGQVNTLNNALTMVIALPLGYLIDRWNYLRLTQLGAAAQGLVCIAGWLLIRDVPTLLAFGICYTIPKMAFTMAMTRSIMGIFPKEKYGQFGSAAAAFSSVVAIGMAIVAGGFVTFMGNYRSNLLWQGLFLLATGLLFVLVERRWNKLGGRQHYRAP